MDDGERGKGEGNGSKMSRFLVAYSYRKGRPGRVRAWEGLVGRTGACADFMMFFDATARSARYGKRWSGNEFESASFLSAFQTTVIERTQKRLAYSASIRITFS